MASLKSTIPLKKPTTVAGGFTRRSYTISETGSCLVRSFVNLLSGLEVLFSHMPLLYFTYFYYTFWEMNTNIFSTNKYLGILHFIISYYY